MPFYVLLAVLYNKVAATLLITSLDRQVAHRGCAAIPSDHVQQSNTSSISNFMNHAFCFSSNLFYDGVPMPSCHSSTGMALFSAFVDSLVSLYHAEDLHYQQCYQDVVLRTMNLC